MDSDRYDPSEDDMESLFGGHDSAADFEPGSDDTDFEVNDHEHDIEDENDILRDHSEYRENEEFSPDIPAFQTPQTLLRTGFSINNESTPLEILQKFITSEIMDNIVFQTNLYADQDKVWHPPSYKDWTTVTVEEMWRFFGITLLMGIVRKPSITDYWSTDPAISTPYFSTVMSRNRFQAILRALHFVNNDDATINKKDRFYKLGTFLPELFANFRSAVNPGEYLCVDESLLKFHGRLSFLQYNPKKRARFGIKLFLLCDCSLGFVLEMLPYQGATTAIENKDWIKTLGFGGATVMTLLQNYFKKHHRVALDNWFLSPTLARELKANGTYVLGTVQRRRKGMPVIQGKLGKGEIETFNDDDILIQRWMDRREVLILNTFMGHKMHLSDSRNPKNTRRKPDTVLLYNKIMGAVDGVDKTVRPYQSVRKTFKWYRKIAFNLVDIAVYNSFKLYNHLHDAKYPYKDFLTDIIHEIFQKYPTTKRAIGRPPSITVRMEAPLRFQNNKHMPIKNLNGNGRPRYSDCIYCRHFRKLRKTTAYSCECCKVRLCIDGPDSCYKRYHTEKTLGLQNRTQSQNNAHRDDDFDMGLGMGDFLLSSTDEVTNSNTDIQYMEIGPSSPDMFDSESLPLV